MVFLTEDQKCKAFARMVEGMSIKDVASLLSVPAAPIKALAVKHKAELPKCIFVKEADQDLDLADRLEDTIEDALDNIQSRGFDESAPHQIVSSVALMIDRMRLLRSQSTANMSLATGLHAYVQYLVPEEEKV